MKCQSCRPSLNGLELMANIPRTEVCCVYKLANVIKDKWYKGGIEIDVKFYFLVQQRISHKLKALLRCSLDVLINTSKLAYKKNNSNTLK